MAIVNTFISGGVAKGTFQTPEIFIKEESRVEGIDTRGTAMRQYCLSCSYIVEGVKIFRTHTASSSKKSHQ